MPKVSIFLRQRKRIGAPSPGRTTDKNEDGAREEDMATLKAQAGQDARVLRENGHAQRTQGAEQAPQEGQKAPGRLSSRAESVVAPSKIPPKKACLKKRDFDRICSRPPVDRTEHYRFFAEPSLGRGARLGVSISSRIGKAVVRNRLRRRLRAAFRERAALAGALDAVIVVRPGIERAAYADLCRLLERSLRRAADAGLGGRAPHKSRKDRDASSEDPLGDAHSALPDFSLPPAAPGV